jgi:hypothetical protein
VQLLQQQQALFQCAGLVHDHMSAGALQDSVKQAGPAMPLLSVGLQLFSVLNAL